MTKLSFLGAAGTVTGSRFLLETRGKKILIDCGLFQGPKELRQRNWDPFPVDPAGVDYVIFTHAHIDHIGYFPRLCKDGFRGKAICTNPTADLAKILLLDSGHLQEEDAEWANKKKTSKHEPALPLFTVEDAEKSLAFFEPHYYGEQIGLGNGITIKFKDAGHILGSSMIDLRLSDEDTRRKIVFCGDLGRPARAILRDPAQVYDVEYLVLESTYGDRLHEDNNSYESFIRVYNESIERGGVLVIPSFAVGRTQTLLYIIRELEEKKLIPSIPVYIDSPMALDATHVYERHIKSQDLSVRVMAINGKNVFKTGQLYLCDSRKKSKALNEIENRAVIISASGMVTGGRILHHLAQRLPNPKNTVLFVGYQAEGTRGRTIVEGHDEVKIYGDMVPIRAHVENISGFSCHADYNETLAWLLGFNRPPKKTFIVHGEKAASESLADKIRDRFGWHCEIPKLEESFLLDL